MKETVRQKFSFITGNYLLLIISWMFMNIALSLPESNYQFYILELGGTELSLGLIRFVNFLGMAAVAFPGGYLADKYGRRWLISTFTFSIALSHLFFAFAPSWHFILLGQAIHSLSLIYQPALFAMAQDSLPPKKRGLGFSLISLCWGIFSLPGPFIAIVILTNYGDFTGMRYIYLLVVAFFLCAALLRIRLKETIINKETIRFKNPNSLISTYKEAVFESYKAWRTVPRTVRYVFLTRILAMLTLALSEVINAVYAKNFLFISEELWWYAFIPNYIGMSVASILVAITMDKIGRKIPMILGLTTLTASSMIFVVGNYIMVGYAMVLISMFLFGFSRALIMASTFVLFTDYVKPKNRGKIMASNNFVSYIINGFGALVLGGLLYSLLAPSPFIMGIGSTIVALVVAILWVHDKKNEEGDKIS